jgi:hypothetical protein
MTSELHPNGWISVPVSPSHEDWAKRTREERDQQFPNLYEEQDTDARWVGDLGELAFSGWLKHEGVQGYRWERHQPAGAADFIIRESVGIGVKTVKRKGPPRTEYTAQISARHADEPVDQFFFLSYEMPARRMWLLGGVARATFLKHAKYYRAGEWVHSKYMIREGHEIYNLDIRYLTPPRNWIDQFR